MRFFSSISACVLPVYLALFHLLLVPVPKFVALCLYYYLLFTVSCFILHDYHVSNNFVIIILLTGVVFEAVAVSDRSTRSMNNTNHGKGQ